MKDKTNLFGIGTAFCAIALLISLALIQAPAQAQIGPDVTPPILTITEPTSNGIHVTQTATVDLAGEVSDERGIDKVAWWSDQGSSGTTFATTDWMGPVYWRANAIPLVAGENLITVQAIDASDNEQRATLTVIYDAPPQPPNADRDIAGQKTKITVWFPDNYQGLDRFSLIGYLQNNPGEPFELPFDSDVTVTGWVTDPADSASELPLFSYTVPAGTVMSANLYRYRRPGSENSGSGIRELEFSNRSSGEARLYLYINNEDLLVDLKAALSDDEFRDFLASLRRYTVTVEIDNKVWKGVGDPLHPSVYTRKVELRYNR